MTINRRSFLASIGAAIAAVLFPRWMAAKKVVCGVGRRSVVYDNLGLTCVLPDDLEDFDKRQMEKFFDGFNSDGEVWYNHEGTTWTEIDV